MSCQLFAALCSKTGRLVVIPAGEPSRAAGIKKTDVSRFARLSGGEACATSILSVFQKLVEVEAVVA
jgi:hypothetical protein